MTPNLHPHTHLIGIGGAGMSAIARVLLGRGVAVSGSDQHESATIAALRALGAKIFSGHAAEHVGEAVVVVRSSAVPDDNPEVIAAQARGITVLKRADYLGELMADHIGIAIAGTHGKTTTTGMIAHIFLTCGLDPTIVVGGTLPSLGGNGRAGDGLHFIIEADEYDRMFLGLRPQIGVITNIEHDHPDIYPTAADYEAAYSTFVEQLPADGVLIAYTDDPNTRRLLVQAAGRVSSVGYGFDTPLDLPTDTLCGRNVQPNELGGRDVQVEQNGILLGRLQLAVPGRHNAANALGALAVALSQGIPFAEAAAALTTFQGMGRRFEIKGEKAGITIIDDYAHHPTEIAATLEAARSRFGQRRIWAVWQPHTFSRTRLFLADFQKCFAVADQVLVLDIYRSREKETLGLIGREVADSLDHPHSHFAQDNAAAVAFLQQHAKPGDVIITMNAGDASAIGEQLLANLQKVEQEAI